jgi:hypothetical protein
MIARAAVDALRDRAPTPESPLLSVYLDVEREAEGTGVADLLDRGALGLDATLLALQEGRVRTLLHAAGFESRGGECPRCGALFADDGGAPLNAARDTPAPAGGRARRDRPWRRSRR